MEDKISNVLEELGKVAKALAVMAEAGLRVLSLFKG